MAVSDEFSPYKRGWNPLSAFFIKTVLQLHFLAWMWFIWYIVSFALLWNPMTCLPMTLYILWIVACQYNRTLKRLIYPSLFRKWTVWKWAADYWQGSLIKTADLDPKKNYIFSFHPHGIAAFSAWLTFGTDGCNFSAKFPGIDLHALTLTTNLRLPFFREYLYFHGIMDASRQNCMNVLLSGPGQSILLAVGGANESLVSTPKTYDLVLKRRKGFVRIALRTGAAIVPCIAFGETNLYPTFKGETSAGIRAVQGWLEKKAGFTLPLFYGELWPFGFLVPFALLAPTGRGPLPVVTGPPVECPKFEGDITSPEGKALVDEWHEKYIAALLALWDKHKDTYAKDRKGEMRVVE